jgi:hypothetical protein
MEKYVADQRKYVYMLCDLLDDLIVNNQLLQVIRKKKTVYKMHDLQHLRDQEQGLCPSLSSQSSRIFEGRSVHFTATYYLKRILKHSKASPSCSVTALIYLERFGFRHPALLLTNRTLQRLVLVAVMTATKFLEDECPSNRYWCSAIHPPIQPPPLPLLIE